MRNIICFGFMLICSSAFSAVDLYDIPIKSSDGTPLSLEQFRGKPLLVVNIATKCGFTQQLKGLEEVYRKYKDKGLVVLGVPSNDFGGQTPESNSEVVKFCQVNYGVSFPLTEKVVVKGEGRHPLIAALISRSKDKSEIKWNFEKFLVDPQGRIVQRFSSKQNPEKKEITQKIESLLSPS